MRKCCTAAGTSLGFMWHINGCILHLQSIIHGNNIITEILLLWLRLRWIVQWRPELCHFTSQLGSHQGGEAYQVLRNRPSGWNRDAHCLQISKTKLQNALFHNQTLVVIYTVLFYFFLHKLVLYVDLVNVSFTFLLHKKMLHFTRSVYLLPSSFSSYTRVWTSPETGTRACSDRFTRSQRVRTLLLLLLLLSHTQQQRIPLCQCQVLPGWSYKQIIAEAK